MRDGEDSDENPLVLPSKKRKTIIKGPERPPKKKLSKREERKLKSVVQRREKKSKRKQLIEDLTKVQISNEKLQLMTSTTESFNQTGKKYVENNSDILKTVFPFEICLQIYSMFV